jgi:hypothetical protein
LASDSTYRDKVDVIDFIINVLREHEKTLDELVGRLEGAFERLPRVEGAERVEKPPAMGIEVRDWEEFRLRCRGAPIVAFEVDGKVFSIYAVKEGLVYNYSEELPELSIRMRKSEDRYVMEEFSVDSLEGVSLAFRKRLNCGLEGAVKGSKVRIQEGVHLINIAYDVNIEEAKRWLSKELKVDKESIIRGRITI